MANLSLTNALNELTNARKGRSEISRLRDVYPEVENALNAGVSRQNILTALHQDGFTMTMQSFEKALYRIRKAKTALLEITRTAPGLKMSDTESPAQTEPHMPRVKTHQNIDSPSEKKPLTPADFRKIQENNGRIDLDALVSGRGVILTDE